MDPTWVTPMRARAAIRTADRRWWSCVAAAALIVIALGLRPVAARACVGDCRGTGVVDINDLIVGVNIALGAAPASDCKAFGNASGMVDISQLVQGVNNALNGCDASGEVVTLTGTCAVPGNGKHGLTLCAAGTPITVFHCDDRSQCAHAQGLSMLGATTVASDGTWSVQVSMADASAALVFQANITNAIVYRTLAFGLVASGALHAGLARDVTFAPIAITPVSEAGV